jgi:hypothetical protein
MKYHHEGVSMGSISSTPLYNVEYDHKIADIDHIRSIINNANIAAGFASLAATIATNNVIPIDNNNTNTITTTQRVSLPTITSSNNNINATQ